MTTLLALPPRDELQLTQEELAGVTGAKARAQQIEWLNTNAWRYTTTRAGDPVVGRLYANLKMAGVEVATIVAPEAWQPDYAASSR